MELSSLSESTGNSSVLVRGPADVPNNFGALLAVPHKSFDFVALGATAYSNTSVLWWKRGQPSMNWGLLSGTSSNVNKGALASNGARLFAAVSRLVETHDGNKTFLNEHADLFELKIDGAKLASRHVAALGLGGVKNQGAFASHDTVTVILSSNQGKSEQVVRVSLADNSVDRQNAPWIGEANQIASADNNQIFFSNMIPPEYKRVVYSWSLDNMSQPPKKLLTGQGFTAEYNNLAAASENELAIVVVVQLDTVLKTYHLPSGSTKGTTTLGKFSIDSSFACTAMVFA